MQFTLFTALGLALPGVPHRPHRPHATTQNHTGAPDASFPHLQAAKPFSPSHLDPFGTRRSTYQRHEIMGLWSLATPCSPLAATGAFGSWGHAEPLQHRRTTDTRAQARACGWGLLFSPSASEYLPFMGETTSRFLITLLNRQSH